MTRHGDGKAILRAALLRFALLLAASYGMLYFADKWYAPTIGSADFTEQYYRMYQKPLDLSAAELGDVAKRMREVGLGRD